MAEARSDQEPSIEEILASIREIISDDEQPPAKAAKPEAAPAPAPAAVTTVSAPVKTEDDDVLDLAAFADTPKMAADIPPDTEDPLSGINFDKPKEMTVAFTEPEPAPMPQSPSSSSLSQAAPAMAMIDKESLLTETAKAASVDSLTRLAQNIAISRAGNGGTLEDIVREMLKPMLREWLDRNLPPMIERMVERELERLAKQAMDR